MPAPLPHDDTQIDCSANGSILAGTLREQIAQLDVAQANKKLGIAANDALVISDSEMNGMVKAVGWANFLSILKQSFDQYYNKYDHPDGDGYHHVPATSTTHNKQVLMAGATPGSEAWTAISLLTWLGAWSNTTDYVKDDCVSYNGSTFRALQASTGVTPAEGTYWTVLAGKGADGTPGTPGTPGAAGASGAYRVDTGTISATVTSNTYGTSAHYKTDLIEVEFDKDFPIAPSVTFTTKYGGGASPLEVVMYEGPTISGFKCFGVAVASGGEFSATWEAKLPLDESGGGTSVLVGPTVVSLKNLGAADDDDVSTLFNNHYSSGSTICVDGRFLVSSPLVVSGRPCVFGFGNNSILYAESNIPIFNCNLNGSMDHPDFHNFCLQNRSGGSSAFGFRFYGTTSGIWMGHGRWKDLSFEGINTGFYFEKVMAASNLEAGYDWNQFTGLDFTSYGSIDAQFGFHFMGGSGTGNQFRGITTVVQNCALAWESYDGANVGDILIDGLHCGGDGKGIFMSNRAAYKSRISIDNAQFDAGLDYGFYIESGYTVVSIGTYNKGGGIVDVLPSGVHNLSPTNY